MISPFLQQLIDDNTLVNYCAYCSNGYSQTLNKAFMWTKTKEGYAYWNTLYAKYSRKFTCFTEEDIKYLIIHYPELLI